MNLTERQQLVYNALNTVEPATNRELAEHLELSVESTSTTLRQLLRLQAVSRWQTRVSVKRTNLQVGKGIPYNRATKTNWIDKWTTR